MVLGIIAEYNPFHNGHLYHLLKAKELTKDNYTIAIIGGNFTQRGEASLVDKWVKTEMALANGIDLVIELPLLYSISSAENFADGAIKILNSLKLVDHIAFGGETDDLRLLNIIANTLFEEPKDFKLLLDVFLSTGISFPKAREKALLAYLNDDQYRNIISMPNNILAIEYLKALKKYKSRIKPVLLRRKDSGFLSLDYKGDLASSTAIRNKLKTSNIDSIKNLIPPTTYTILNEEFKLGHYVRDISCFEKIILYKFRNMSIQEIANLPDVSEGLENSLKKAACSCNTFKEFINIVSSKRYTETRLKRIMLYCLLDISKKDMQISKRTTPYVRVLGFNKKGEFLLSKISKANPKLACVTSVKKFIDSPINKSLNTLINKDIHSTDIYTLGFANDSWSNLDFTKKIIKK